MSNRLYSWLIRLLEAAWIRRREVKGALGQVDRQIEPQTAPRLKESASVEWGICGSALGSIESRRIAKAQPGNADLLQFPGSRKIQVTEIVVGYDFGTSSSKIVIQSPYKLGGRAVAVPFEDVGHPSCPYLVPAHVTLSARDHFSLQQGDDGRTIRHLKIGILDHFERGRGSSSIWSAGDPSVWALAHIALVLRQARAWFLETQADSYGNDKINWSLNLGVPSAGYSDQAILREFEAIAEAAWILSLSPATPQLTDVENVLRRTRRQRGEAIIAVGVVPEVAAEVVGYAKSKYRDEGLHVLVDLGASTLDICGFILHSDGEGDIYELLTTEVSRLGLLDLHKRRMYAAASSPPFDRVPDDLIFELPEWEVQRIGPKSQEAFQRCDQEYRKDCVQALMRTLASLKRDRVPLSRQWETGLPVFLCGGGVRSRAVSTLLSDTNERASRTWSSVQVLRRALPSLGVLGQDGSQISDDTFSRLGVAFGLSHEAINIGRPVPPEEIPNMEAPWRRSNWQDRFIDKDQV